MSSSFFGGKKKATAKKKATNDEFTFTLRDIDITKIDKNFNMGEMKNIGGNNDTNELIFDIIDEGTSLEKLGISSLHREPIITVIPKEKTKLQTFVTMTNFITGKKLPQQTGIPCFGCHRCFSTVPIGIPIEYYPSIYVSKNDLTKIKKLTVNERQKLEQDETNNIIFLEYFDIDGIVCSFNCIYQVIEDNPSPLYKKTPSLIPYLYKMIFGMYPKEKIIKSPSWKLREQYGGPLTDDEFVKNLQTIKFTDMHQISKMSRLMNPVGRVFRVSDVPGV